MTKAVVYWITVLLLLCTGLVGLVSYQAYYGTGLSGPSQGSGSSLGETTVLIAETFELDEEEYRAVSFTLDGEVEVYWEWKSSEDINFYLLTAENFELWEEDDSDTEWIHKRKFRDSGCMVVTLGSGSYVLLWNSPYSDVEVTAKAVLRG